jgi:multimeric flavodoxin WrbA
LIDQEKGIRRSSLLRILGISGSPRKKGNTTLLLKEALAAAKDEEVKTELVAGAHYVG